MILRFKPGLTDFKSDCWVRLDLLGDPKDSFDLIKVILFVKFDHFQTK